MLSWYHKALPLSSCSLVVEKADVFSVTVQRLAGHEKTDGVD